MVVGVSGRHWVAASGSFSVCGVSLRKRWRRNGLGVVALVFGVSVVVFVCAETLCGLLVVSAVGRRVGSAIVVSVFALVGAASSSLEGV